MLKGSNPLDVRRNNRQSLLLALHHYGGQSKQSLVERLGLSLQTVSTIVKSLQEEGLLCVGGVTASTGGRKPMLNMLAPDARYACGVGITRNNIRTAVVNLCSETVYTEKRRIEFSDTPAYWREAAAARDRALVSAGVPADRFLGTGLSIPGVMDRSGSAICFAPSLQVSSIPLRPLYDIFGGAFQVTNDAASAGFSYMWNKRSEGSAVYLLLNRGVGGAIIEGKSLDSGKRSGEFGHMTIVKDGVPCPCGRRGCLEAYCSSGVIREQSGLELDAFFDALDAGDEKSKRIWDTYLEYLAVGVNNLRVIFDRDVILGGEMSRYVGRSREQLGALLRARNPFGDAGDYVQFSDYGEFDSTVGCAHMMLERFFS